MKNEIIFREFQKEDSKIMEEIIIEAWHYNDLCSSKTAHKMAKDSKIHKCPLKYRIKQIFSIMSLYLSNEGRKISKIFSSVSNIDKELLNECKVQYQGEVAFFAISSKARGKGIGKKMFCDMLKYMKSQNINDFYLFTDTTCNYGFYEHQGMTRRNEKSQKFVIQGKEVEKIFFIYDYCIN